MIHADGLDGDVGVCVRVHLLLLLACALAGSSRCECVCVGVLQRCETGQCLVTSRTYPAGRVDHLHRVGPAGLTPSFHTSGNITAFLFHDSVVSSVFQ